MLNLFAATGHIHYVKSARLYLQNMLNLESNFPWVYVKFSNEGFHTIRRNQRIWAGLWTDLTIEQVIMRSIKSRGGLKKGCGVTESVGMLWINSTHSLSGIHEAMTDLTRLKHKTSVQHAEMSDSRIRKDNQTLQQLKAWFDTNNSFDVNCPELRSLSNGLVAMKEDNINCDEAEIVGEAIQTKLNGAEILSRTIQCKDQIHTLSCLEDLIKIENETVYVKPEVLFNRLTLLVQKDDERITVFQHKLTPKPASLFEKEKCEHLQRTFLEIIYCKVKEKVNVLPWK